MGETNKRHNRKIWRACPVCKGRVVLGYRNQNWWVYCEYDASHIPQRFFPHPHEAIEAWNVKGNKMTNADRIRSMTDGEMADYFSELSCWPNAGRNDCRRMANCMDCWLDWLRQEANDGNN